MVRCKHLTTMPDGGGLSSGIPQCLFPKEFIGSVHHKSVHMAKLYLTDAT